MLKQRILTALILGVILVSIIFSGSEMLFALLMAFTVLFAAWEWAGLCNIQHGPSRILYAAIVTGLVILFYFALYPPWTESVYTFGTVWWSIAVIMVIYFQNGRKAIPENRFLQYLMGCCVLLPAALSLIYLYESDNGQYSVLMFFILIWIVDSSAYFVGRQWGKKRLADQVSPGKSWEGFFGSLLAAGLLAVIYTYIKGITGVGSLWLIILFVITAGFSVIGDLFESMFKRHVNLKDSSQLLPGHGGVLDRIDSLTAAAPVFMLGLWILEGRI